MCDDQATGPPRCYFCGRRFPEADARKTAYAIGPGQRIRVLICPACHRARPPRSDLAGRSVVAVVLGAFLAILVPVLLFFGWVASVAWDHHQKWEGSGPKAGEVRSRYGVGP